jgi:hypothetical protein
MKSVIFLDDIDLISPENIDEFITKSILNIKPITGIWTRNQSGFGQSFNTISS